MSKNYSSKVIKVAKKEVGYKEKKTNAYLYFKEKNAGTNNYTKYGKWIGANGDYWCASFLSWIFYKAYGNAEGKEVLHGGYSPACETIRMNFVRKKSFKTKNPKKGDVIFFKGTRHSGANHIGLVIEVKDGRVYTIEGNADDTDSDNGGAVVKKSYPVGYSRILGYGVPKYDKKPKAAVTKKCNLYKAANTIKGSHRTMTAGNQVTFIKDNKKGWSKVKYDGKVGYIKNTCLRYEKTLSKYPTAATKEATIIKNKNNKKSMTIGTIPKGAKLSVVSKGTYWANVKVTYSHKTYDGFIPKKKIK